MPIVESKKRNSFLGGVALMVGLSAIGLSYIEIGGLPSLHVGPWTLPFPLALDFGVIALALLATLLAASSRRTGTELPLTALLVGIVALTVYYFHHRPNPPSGATVVARPQSPTTAHNSLPPAISQKTKSQVVTSAANAANATTQAVASVAQQSRVDALRDARANFAAAKQNVIDSLKDDPNYQAAKSNYDTARARLLDARSHYPQGDPRLVTLSQAAIQAETDWNHLVNEAVEKDPKAAAAKAQVDALSSR